MTNRYRIAVTVERLKDVEGHTDPASGKVQEHNRQVGQDGPWVAVVPEWEQVAGFGGSNDGDTIREALPGLLQTLGEAFQEVEMRVDLIDQD